MSWSGFSTAKQAYCPGIVQETICWLWRLWENNFMKRKLQYWLGFKLGWGFWLGSSAMTTHTRFTNRVAEPFDSTWTNWLVDWLGVCVQFRFSYDFNMLIFRLLACFPVVWAMVMPTPEVAHLLFPHSTSPVQDYKKQSCHFCHSK